ncbi:MAG: sulfite exporter TauE/SafE family protein [Rhodospirillales bacterium]
MMAVGTLGAAFLFFAAMLTTVINVVAGLGGGMVLFAAMAAVIEYAVMIPMYGLTQLSGASTRMILFRRHIQIRVLGLFLVAFVPFYVLGLIVWRQLIEMPDVQPFLKIGIAVYLIVFLLCARFLKVKPAGQPKLMLISGALIGFTSNILGAVGPLMAPFFIALNLNKNEFVGTWSTAAVLVSLSKLPLFYFIWDKLSFGHFVLLVILVIGSSIGAFVGKHLLGKISEDLFRKLLHAFLALIACKLLLWDGVRTFFVS